MYLFRDQVNLSDNEKGGLKEICLFIVAAYQKYWFTANKPQFAASNDLKFIQTLNKSTAINSKISRAALDKISSHLTYLNEVLIGLAFFDIHLTVAVKRKMAKAVKSRSNSLISNENNTALLDLSNSKNLNNITIDKFVSKKCLYFFEILNISSDFLNDAPEKWESMPEYLKSLETIKNLPVVNDNAERAVALATKFNESITKDENQRQYLLQVVHDNRKKLPNCNKKSFNYLMNK